jgi:ubiquinone/menaquinone biosynthesis C-methylase UbiE
MTGHPVVRRGEYAARGDYHRLPDPDWDYYPTYIAKLEYVRGWLNRLPSTTRVLDAGCGEGVLIDEYAGRLAIEGLDANYTSPDIRHGSVCALPYPDAAFDRALCLDVLEHLPFDQQSLALSELYRVLKPGGELLVSVPNLAHLQSRVHFLAKQAGFLLAARRGIFPTVPVLTRIIRRHPRGLLPLHRLLSRLLPIPGWCFLNLLTFRKP